MALYRIMGLKYRDIIKGKCRDAIKDCLNYVAAHGFDGDEHLYIVFDTNVPGVLMSGELLSKFPKEMIVVLQHQFANLIVNPRNFEVTLSFNGVLERIAVPFDAIQCFYDPASDFNIEIHDDSILMLHRSFEAQNDDNATQGFSYQDGGSLSLIKAKDDSDYGVYAKILDRDDTSSSMERCDEKHIADHNEEGGDPDNITHVFEIKDYIDKDKI